jgi:hypothetical protein
MAIGCLERAGKTYLLVASSRIKTRLRTLSARASASNCLSPMDQSDADNSVYSPPSLWTRFHRPTFLRADSILSSVASPWGSRLNRRVPGMNKGSEGTVLSRARRVFRGTVDRSTPSTMMRPCWISISWRRARINDVLPLPEGPQMAIFSPARIFRDRFRRIGALAEL